MPQAWGVEDVCAAGTEDDAGECGEGWLGEVKAVSDEGGEEDVEDEKGGEEVGAVGSGWLVVSSPLQ